MALDAKTARTHSIATRLLLIVLGLYFLVATTVTVTHIWMEYRYQKENILTDLEQIEEAFAGGLAVSLWGMDEEALAANTKGMLMIPTLVGVKVLNAEKKVVSIAGLVEQDGEVGNVGLHVKLSGCSEADLRAHEDEHYQEEMFKRTFPIEFKDNSETILLGEATIYSNSAIIYRRMQLQIGMLGVNVLLTLVTFCMALLWAVNRYLRRPLNILTNAASSISLENLNTFHVDTQTDVENEIKVLETTLNSVVGNLHDEIRSRKQVEGERKIQAERVHRQQEAVIRISQVNPLGQRLGPLLREVSEIVAKGIDVEYIGIWFFDPGLKTLHCAEQLTTSTWEHASGEELDLKALPTYWDAFKTCKRLVVDDAINDSRTAELVGAYLQPKNIVSMLDASIRMKGEIKGVLCLEHAGSIRTWTEDEGIFAERVADQVASFLSERALEESSRHLASAQQIAHVGSWELNHQSQALYWSDEVYRIFGIEAEGYIPSYEGFLSCVDPRDRERVTQAFCSSLDEERDEYEIEHRIIRQNTGEIRCICEKCNHIRNDRGQVIRSVGMAHDVTEWKEAEAALRSNEENLRITLNSIGDAVIATDEQGQVRRMNPVAQTLTGWAEKEALGKPLPEIFQIVDAVTRKACANPVEQVLARGEIVGLAQHTLLIARDGTEYQVADSGAPIRSGDGGIVGVVLVFRDVTEQYRLENQLRQSEKLQAVGQLAGGVAHDFNNMLGGILGAAELLIKEVERESKAYRYADMISQAAGRAADLTEKLLDFSRKGKQLSTPVDIHAIIRETVSILERSIDKRIDLTCHLGASKSTVIGDPSQLQNAILNLGINARDAMLDGGSLRLSTENRVLDQTYCDSCAGEMWPGDYIMISVSDTGVGIPATMLGNIFEPFFTTKEQGKGTGLGLAAVYGSVQDHKGDIKVYSEAGKGSVFHLYLPVEDSRECRREDQAGIPERQGRGTILLVDDEEIIRAIAAPMLEEMGYTVLTAMDGEDGLRQYKQHLKTIDLVLLDMVMPRLNGTETFRAIRKINPEAKVVLSSGFARDARIEDLKAEGLLGFVKKPFRCGELADLLATHLR